jgi:hypothetical protein
MRTFFTSGDKLKMPHAEKLQLLESPSTFCPIQISLLSLKPYRTCFGTLLALILKI